MTTETFLSRFTPSLMSPEALEAIFVQREDLAQRVVGLVRDSALTEAKHHTLLVGPRGIGKTHLVSLVYHRVRQAEDLRGRLLIAWLREEEWGVASFLDLLLRTLASLQSEQGDAALAERIESLYELPAEEAERAAAALLKEYVGRRTLLLIMENLDELFGGLGDTGQKRLRAYLQENPFCTILATSQSLFGGVSLQTSPFYGFFRIQHLEDLSLEEATQLLTNIASFKGDRELASFIQTPTGRARIRALRHLAGGNHRVYVIFSRFLTRESLDQLVEPFMRMLDDLTPYYQARMQWLSPQQRKIVEFLCERRGAVTVKEIAQRSFMTHQTASSQLKSLREMGYVKSEAIGRESFYELREPLMRLSIEVKKHRDRPIRLFIDFLRLWHSTPELQQQLAALSADAKLEREYLLLAIQIAESEGKDPRVEACSKDGLKYLEENDYAHLLEIAEELVEIRGDADDWFTFGHSLVGLNRWEEAIEKLTRTVDLDPNHIVAYSQLGLAYFYLERFEESLQSFDKAVELNKNNAVYWGARGAALEALNRLQDALEAYDRAIELNPNYSYAVFRRVSCLFRLNRWSEGLFALDRALGQFAHTDEHAANCIRNIVTRLFMNSPEARMWQVRSRELVDICSKNSMLTALGQGIVQNVSDMMSPTVSDAVAAAWRDVWRGVAEGREELELPVRLLDAAVRYRETRDQRVLLELPAEERAILEEALQKAEASEPSGE